MKQIIFSTYDKAVVAYMRPWFAISEGQALRAFADEVQREGSDLKKHPEDYALFRMGTFDDNSGELVAEEPTCLARAHELPTEGNGNA